MEQEFNFNNELSGKIALVTGGTKGIAIHIGINCSPIVQFGT